MASGRITYLGHSTFRLTLPDERVILIDPWLTDNPKCPESEKSQPRCDFVVLTHGHSDHTGDVAKLIKQHAPQVVAIFDLTSLFENEYPDGKYNGMNIGGTLDLEGISFSMTRAFHSSSIPTGEGQAYAGDPAGFVIQAPGLASVYHAGDTDVFSDMKLIEQLYAPKIVMLPIGDHFTMGPKGAALAARFFDPSAVVPMHYGTFPLLTGTVEAFRQELGADFAQRVVALEPGRSADWTAQGLSA